MRLLKRQYQRHLKVVFGNPTGSRLGQSPTPMTLTSYAGDGPRIAFRANRNNRGEADRCTLLIFNPPPEMAENIKQQIVDLREARKQIQSDYRKPRRQRPYRDGQMQKTSTDELEIGRLSDTERGRRLEQVTRDYRVSIFTGYGRSEDDLVLTFRGDMTDVTYPMRRGGTDTILKIDLGDTIYALRDSYNRQVLRANTSVLDMISGLFEANGIDTFDAVNYARLVLPNAVVSQIRNRYYVVGRLPDTIPGFIELLGAQWWVQDSRLYLAPQGATLPDFAIWLTEGQDLLDFTEPRDRGDYQGRAQLNGNIVPGRQLILRDFDGKLISPQGFRVQTTDVRADTRGPAWHTTFECTNTELNLAAQADEFVSPSFIGGVPIEEFASG